MSGVLLKHTLEHQLHFHVHCKHDKHKKCFMYINFEKAKFRSVDNFVEDLKEQNHTQHTITNGVSQKSSKTT